MQSGIIRAAVVCGLLLFGGAAQGSSFRVIYNFCAGANCTDGQFPVGSLTTDAKGNIYGVTESGAAGQSDTVYELKRGHGRQYKLNTLYQFCKNTGCADGRLPLDGVVRDVNGNLYGMTYYGGATDEGVAYKLAPQQHGEWTETVLRSFDGASGSRLDGAFGYIGKISGQPYDGVSPLFGTTQIGGTDPNGGTAFTLTPDGSGWDFETIFNFSFDLHTGYQPFTTPVLDTSGHVYGTANGDVVWKLTHKNGIWKEDVIYQFCQGCNDGIQGPDAITIAPSGAIVGTAAFFGPYCTYHHGLLRRCGGGVFKLTPDGTSWDYTALYDFCAVSKACKDGKISALVTAPVVDSSGNVYGTATRGGKYDNGVLFRIQTDGTYEVLHSFCEPGNCSDGASPTGLVMSSKGNIFGDTGAGATNNGGAIFEYTP